MEREDEQVVLRCERVEGARGPADFFGAGEEDEDVVRVLRVLCGDAGRRCALLCRG